MQAFLTKYHIWVVVAATAAIAGAQIILGVPVPDYVYTMLASLGIVSVRVSFQQTAGVVGWKTYALAGGEAILGGLRAYGIQVPLEVDGILVSLAGGTMVTAMQKA